MTIDNTNTVVADRKLMYILPVSATILLSIIGLMPLFDNPVLGLNRSIYIIAVIVIFLVIFCYRFFLNLNYLNYSDANETITIKYYSLRPFMLKRQTIQIQHNTFVKFELKKSFFGQKKSLVLYQKVKGKVAKYSALSLSAYNKEQTEMLIHSLSAIAKFSNQKN